MIDFNIGIKSECVARSIEPDGTVIELDKAHNMMLDGFLEFFNPNAQTTARASMPDNLRIGSSASPTLPSMATIQTAIASETGHANSIITSVVTVEDTYADVDESGTMYRVFTNTLRFTAPKGYVIGDISEVGLTHSTSSSTDGIITRIVLGSPITGTADNQLQFDYTWTVKVPHDVTTTISADVDGVPTDIEVVARVCKADTVLDVLRWSPNSTEWQRCHFDDRPETFPVVGGYPTTPRALNVTPAIAVGSVDIAQRKTKVDLLFSASQINLPAGIATAYFYSHYQYMLFGFKFTPALPSTDKQELAITVSRSYISI